MKGRKTQIPLVALVGYTNAGKSTLLNALCAAEVFVEDKLFATLDTTTRKLALDETTTVLLSDTVGFIRKLPHHLVDAFKATLKKLFWPICLSSSLTLQILLRRIISGLWMKF